MLTIEELDFSLSNRSLWNIIRKNKNLYTQLLERTAFLDKSVDFSERLYCFYNKILEYPKCLTCWTTILVYLWFQEWYRKYCCKKCANINQSKKEKCKETCIERYGGKNPMSSKEIRDKSNKTCQEKYNVDNISQVEEIKQKKEKTLFSNYWVSYSNLHYKLNSKFLYKNRSIQENLQIKKKREDTCLKKHGVKNIFLSPSHQELCSKNKRGWWRSSVEKEIEKYIVDNFPNYKIKVSTRSIIWPKELDIYIPELKIWIEYNWLMYHSYWEQSYSYFPSIKDKEKVEKQHFNKFKLCLDKGVRLYQIYENEWLINKELELKRLHQILSNKEEYVFKDEVILSLDKENILWYLERGYSIESYFEPIELYFYNYDSEKVYSTRQNEKAERIFKMSGKVKLRRNKINNIT